MFGYDKINNTFIAARSQNISSKYSLYHTKKEAIKAAWTSFWERVAQEKGFSYDEDEGISLRKELSNVREGWVYYD